MQALIRQRLPEIVALSQTYGIARLEVFGSAATAAFDPTESDVDFLVTYPAGYDFGPWLGRFQDFEAELAEILGVRVNLVMDSALRNRWFAREAARTRTVIHDASTHTRVA